MKKLLIILIATLLFSCSAQKRASRKIHRKLDKVEKLIKLYPELSDSIYTTHTDTITIKGSSDSISYVLKKDTLYVDSILKAYERLYKHKASIEQQIQDSLLKYDSIGFDVKSATQKDNELYRLSIKQLNLKKLKIESELNILKRELIEKVIQNGYFEYSDTLIDANIEIKEGKLFLKYEIKDRDIIHETKYKKVEIKEGKSTLTYILMVILVMVCGYTIYKIDSK